MSDVRLLRDVLDKQIMNRRAQPLGKVDGIVLALGRGRPRVCHLETGGAVLAARVHPRLAGWAIALRRRWGDGDVTPATIPWSDVEDVGVTVTVNVDARESRALTWERWLRRHVLERIPGA